MGIKKLEIIDPEILEAIKKRYELLHDAHDQLSDVDFDNQVRAVDRFIAFGLCRIYGAVMEARKFGAAK